VSYTAAEAAAQTLSPAWDFQGCDQYADHYNVSTMKSAPLKELVAWVERSYGCGGPIGSAFEEPVFPVLVMKVEAALTWSVTTGLPVQLFTTDISVRALLSGLVLRRSSLDFRRVFQGELTEDDFGRLTCCVGEIRQSGFEMIEGSPPSALRSAAFMGGPLFAVVAPEDAVGSLVQRSAPKVPALG